MTRRFFIAAAPAAAQTAHEEIVAMAEHAPMAMRFRGSTAADAREWQSRFGTQLRRLLGNFDPPARWETIEESIHEAPDHTRRSLLLKAPGAPSLPVYVLEPKGHAGKRPAILALHGHGPHGHDAVVGVASSTIAYDYGLALVRRGYLVAAPCFTPFGRRLGDRKAYGGDDPCAVEFVRLQMLGRVLIAENLRDVLWSQALLERHPMAKANALGCVGLSYGGRMTMLATALSPRIRVAVVSGALNAMQERIRGRYSCGAQAIPGLLEHGDVPEIGALIAPRPCVWEVGNRDGLMVKDWIEPSWARIRSVYAALGAGDALELDRFDGAHQWHGERAYPLLARVLGS
ncbi:MAG: hypothetical protein R2729_25445 [Bryobacteraceae bacterium]